MQACEHCSGRSGQSLDYSELMTFSKKGPGAPITFSVCTKHFLCERRQAEAWEHHLAPDQGHPLPARSKADRGSASVTEADLACSCLLRRGPS